MEAFIEKLGLGVLLAFAYAVVMLLPAYFAMIVLGILHANEGWAINFGFWTTWGILYLIAIVGSSFNGSRS